MPKGRPGRQKPFGLIALLVDWKILKTMAREQDNQFLELHDMGRVFKGPKERIDRVRPTGDRTPPYPPGVRQSRR